MYEQYHLHSGYQILSSPLALSRFITRFCSFNTLFSAPLSFSASSDSLLSNVIVSGISPDEDASSIVVETFVSAPLSDSVVFSIIECDLGSVGRSPRYCSSCNSRGDTTVRLVSFASTVCGVKNISADVDH